MLLGPALVYALLVGSRTRGRRLVAAARLPALAAGVALMGAFGLALAALQLAPAAPVAAVRESSVVIATVLAPLALGETVRRPRVVGAVLVVVGVGVLAAS